MYNILYLILLPLNLGHYRTEIVPLLHIFYSRKPSLLVWFCWKNVGKSGLWSKIKIIFAYIVYIFHRGRFFYFEFMFFWTYRSNLIIFKFFLFFFFFLGGGPFKRLIFIFHSVSHYIYLINVFDNMFVNCHAFDSDWFQ